MKKIIIEIGIGIGIVAVLVLMGFGLYRFVNKEEKIPDASSEFSLEKPPELNPTTREPVTTKPKETTKEPETTTKEPEATTKEPDTTTKEPEATTKEPDTTTKEPETTTKQTETTTKEPETTTKKPETTTKEPETTTKEPETTNVQPTDFFPEQVDGSVTIDRSTVGNETVQEKSTWIELSAFGMDTSIKGKYTGEWKDDMPNGFGTFYHTGNYFTSGQKECIKIIGHWKDGKPEGDTLIIQVVHTSTVDLDSITDFSSFNYTAISYGEYKDGVILDGYTVYEGTGGGDSYIYENVIGIPEIIEQQPSALWNCKFYIH